MSEIDRNKVVLAEIIRPRGIRGEMLAISQTDVPGRLENLKRVQAQLADGSDVEVDVESVWEYRGGWVFKFAGVDSIDAADRFRRADLWVPLAERAELPEGEYFQSDLVGCMIIDRETGRDMGLVHGFQHYGGPPLLEVKVDGREVLIPFVPQICLTVDLQVKQIRVDLPAGLLEL